MVQYFGSEILDDKDRWYVCLSVSRLCIPEGVEADLIQLLCLYLITLRWYMPQIHHVKVWVWDWSKKTSPISLHIMYLMFDHEIFHNKKGIIKIVLRWLIMFHDYFLYIILDLHIYKYQSNNWTEIHEIFGNQNQTIFCFSDLNAFHLQKKHIKFKEPIKSKGMDSKRSIKQVVNVRNLWYVGSTALSSNMIKQRDHGDEFTTFKASNIKVSRRCG